MTTRPPIVSAGATFSPDRRYRYVLHRSWEPAVESLLFIMLNPSTADENMDDPTIRRCMGFAHAWGFGGVIVRNLYALRATKPKHLWEADDPVGPDNDEGLWVGLQWAPRVIAAWGANAKPDRVARFWELAAPRVDERTGWGPIEALRLTKGGSPAHPLYVPGNVKPVTLRGPS